MIRANGQSLRGSCSIENRRHKSHSTRTPSVRAHLPMKRIRVRVTKLRQHIHFELCSSSCRVGKCSSDGRRDVSLFDRGSIRHLCLGREDALSSIPVHHGRSPIISQPSTPRTRCCCSTSSDPVSIVQSPLSHAARPHPIDPWKQWRNDRIECRLSYRP